MKRNNIIFLIFMVIPFIGCISMPPKIKNDSTPLAPFAVPNTEQKSVTEISTNSIVAIPTILSTPFPTLDFIPSGKIILDNTILSADGSFISSVVMPLKTSSNGVELSQIGAWDFHWSNNGKYLAFQCVDKPFGEELNLCILDVNYLNDNNPEFLYNYLKVSRLYDVSKIEGTSFGPFLGSISWSPDDKYVIISIKGAKSPCVINVSDGGFSCGISSVTSSGLSESDSNLLAEATMISWSPKELSKLVFPHRNKNLYLLDLGDGIIKLLWNTADNNEINSEQAPIWSPDGKKIAFVFLEPGGEKVGSRWSESNYVIGQITESGSEYKELIDGKGVYRQIEKLLPEEYQGGNVGLHLYSWSPDGRFLLFSAYVNKRGLDPSAYNYSGNKTWGTFYLDLRTGAVIPFAVDFITPYGLAADWGP